MKESGGGWRQVKVGQDDDDDDLNDSFSFFLLFLNGMRG
jgi:hypothetical protein